MTNMKDTIKRVADWCKTSMIIGVPDDVEAILDYIEELEEGNEMLRSLNRGMVLNNAWIDNTVPTLNKALDLAEKFITHACCIHNNLHTLEDREKARETLSEITKLRKGV